MPMVLEMRRGSAVPSEVGAQSLADDLADGIPLDFDGRVIVDGDFDSLAERIMI